MKNRDWIIRKIAIFKQIENQRWVDRDRYCSWEYFFVVQVAIYQIKHQTVSSSSNEYYDGIEDANWWTFWSWSSTTNRTKFIGMSKLLSFLLPWSNECEGYRRCISTRSRSVQQPRFAYPNWNLNKNQRTNKQITTSKTNVL